MPYVGRGNPWTTRHMLRSAVCFHGRHDPAVDDRNEMAVGQGIQQVPRPWPIDTAHKHVAVQRGRNTIWAQYAVRNFP